MRTQHDEPKRGLREGLIVAFLAQDKFMNGDGHVEIECRADAAFSVFREWLKGVAKASKCDNERAIILDLAEGLSQ